MGVERRLAAVLAADIVGFSRLMGRDEEGTLARVKGLLDEVIRPKVAECRGRVVKTTGDGVLAEFGSVFNAFQCALEIQQIAAERNIGRPADDLFVMRMGLNIGDIIFDEDDVFGDGVNIAARLENLARPGSICVSYRAWDDLRKLQLPFTDMGEQRLKNIAQPVRVFSYTPPAPGPTEPAAAGQAQDLMRRYWRIAAGVAAAAMVVAGIGAAVLRKPPPTALDYVTEQLGQRACSWLRVSDHSSVDGFELFKLSGAALDPPGTISQTLLQSAKQRRLRVDEIEAADVAPLDQSQCQLIDALKAYRYGGVPRFGLAMKAKAKGRTRVEVAVDPRELGPFGVVYGIEPSGAVERIIDSPGLAKVGPPAVIRRADGSYTLNIDIDHMGWNGIVFLESKTPVPEGVVEQAARSPADRETFDTQARSGGWRFELAWFRVDADSGRK